MQPWWERWSRRYDDELDRLSKGGITFAKDEQEWQKGRLVLNLSYTVAGEPLELVAHFPDTYPFTRFEIVAPKLDLVRHQNPFGKHLCLIARSTRNWNIDDTLADFLLARVPLLLELVKAPANSNAGQEEPQGEPFTDYYPYVTDTSVMVDSGWKLDPSITAGQLIVTGSANPIFRGAVVRVTRDGTTLAAADPAIAKLFTTTFQGRWVRWHEPIKSDTFKGILGVIATKFPYLKVPKFGTGRQPLPEVIGVVFPEEVRQGEFEDGWIFLIRDSQHEPYLARAVRAGRIDVTGRIPELQGLQDKRFAVIGLGALGALSAIELARSGVRELRMVDHDFVEAGTTCRWPLGLTAAGKIKSDVVQKFVSANYPYTQVIAFNGLVGGALPGFKYTDRANLETLLDVDLVYDATAETGLQYFLSRCAFESKIPYLSVSTTSGAWGGLLTRIRPGKTAGCWTCLQHAFNLSQIPTPADDLTGSVQVQGCKPHFHRLWCGRRIDCPCGRAIRDIHTAGRQRGLSIGSMGRASLEFPGQQRPNDRASDVDLST
ncbi:MAG: ThiF family adenylyltransferase [Betaproteobacteria bacterium]|nr:ThiF family adenylyltransferase [Betaproteobacteria bacterium]